MPSKMNKRQLKACHLLAQFGRAEILKWFKPDSCIASTKVAVKVLSHFKIPVRPKCFSVEIMNPKYRELFDQQHCHPTKENGDAWLAQGAWEIAIDGHTPDSSGHVVAIVADKFLLDLSLDQASRPHKNLKLEPALLPLPDNWSGQPVLLYEEPDGMRLMYHRVDNENYRKANDWCISERTTPVAKDIIRLIERKL